MEMGGLDISGMKEICIPSENAHPERNLAVMVGHNELLGQRTLFSCPYVTGLSKHSLNGCSSCSAFLGESAAHGGRV